MTFLRRAEEGNHFLDTEDLDGKELPATNRFDHDPLLPGWQTGTLPAPVEATQPFVDPTNGRTPADGPFAFLANPFLLTNSLGGGGGPAMLRGNLRLIFSKCLCDDLGGRIQTTRG